MTCCLRLLLAFSLFLLPMAATAENTGVAQPTGLELVRVKGGCFQQGSSQGASSEKPQHEVCLHDYFIGKYEITQRDWQDVMGFNPTRHKACGEDCPVDSVSWSDAREFVSRLNAITGRSFRLPTEAEWEFACRERGKTTSYCGSNAVETVAWQRLNSGNGPHPVGRKQPNSLGIFDMSGNVWEWVQDWNGKYPSTRQNDPKGPSAGSSRVRRGGSWQYEPEKARAAWRSSGYADDRAMDIGFRLAHP
jgi:formylglycine-generating enzyme required for sulfatase activity